MDNLDTRIKQCQMDLEILQRNLEQLQREKENKIKIYQRGDGFLVDGSIPCILTFDSHTSQAALVDVEGRVGYNWISVSDPYYITSDHIRGMTTYDFVPIKITFNWKSI